MPASPRGDSAEVKQNPFSSGIGQWTSPLVCLVCPCSIGKEMHLRFRNSGTRNDVVYKVSINSSEENPECTKHVNILFHPFLHPSICSGCSRYNWLTRVFENAKIALFFPHIHTWKLMTCLFLMQSPGIWTCLLISTSVFGFKLKLAKD